MIKHTIKFVKNWMNKNRLTDNDMRTYAHNYTGESYNTSKALYDYLVTLSAEELKFMTSIQ